MSAVRPFARLRVHHDLYSRTLHIRTFCENKRNNLERSSADILSKERKKKGTATKFIQQREVIADRRL